MKPGHTSTVRTALRETGESREANVLHMQARNNGHMMTIGLNFNFD